MHLVCLSRELLSTEDSKNTLIPRSGNCPRCKESFHWSDFLRNVSKQQKVGVTNVPLPSAIEFTKELREEVKSSNDIQELGEILIDLTLSDSD